MPKKNLKPPTDVLNDTTQKPQDGSDFPMKNDLDTEEKDLEDAETMEIPSTAVSEQKLPLSREMSRSTLNETDLRNHRQRLEKAKVAAEMLEAGWSIRDTAQELKLPKGFVEKISRKLRTESVGATSDARKEYLAKPYEYGLKKLQEEDGESLLESGWLEKTQRKIWKLKIEQDMMRKAGLIDGDGDSGNGSRINLNEILLAKVVASGGNTSAQELASFAAALKTLFAPQPGQDPLQFYATIKNLENQSIQQARTLESEAYARAKADNDRGLVHEVVDKVAPALGDVAKGLMNAAVRPQIPQPAPLSSIPSPLQIPEGEILSMGKTELESLNLPNTASNEGYSNLQKFKKESSEGVAKT